MTYLGAAIAHEEHVETFDVAVDDADQGVVQILQGGRHLAHGPHALVRGGRGVAAQFVEPVAARHPLHYDEGVRGVQAGGDNLNAVWVSDLNERGGCVTVTVSR